MPMARRYHSKRNRRLRRNRHRYVRPQVSKCWRLVVGFGSVL
jgi:hypothetical protein